MTLRITGVLDFFHFGLAKESINSDGGKIYKIGASKEADVSSAVAQAVGRRHLTAAARVRAPSQVMSVGIVRLRTKSHGVYFVLFRLHKLILRNL
jgi:hypothetical protein